jgi:hypothetical protein
MQLIEIKCTATGEENPEELTSHSLALKGSA